MAVPGKIYESVAVAIPTLVVTERECQRSRGSEARPCPPSLGELDGMVQSMALDW